MPYGQVADVRLEGAPIVPGTPAEGAFRLLRTGLALLAIIAGVDKFFNALVSWEQYLAPSVVQFLPMSPAAFMRIGGIAEILVGLLVAANPRLGGTIMGFWLIAIIGNLLLSGGYYDIAARDAGLAIAAFALARLALHRELTRPIVTMPSHHMEVPEEAAHA
jgi:hypothetical protein